MVILINGVPQGGSGGGGTGDVVVDDPTPTLTLINSAGGANLRRWQIGVNTSGELLFDSQNDAGVSYGRPIVSNIFNGGLVMSGPVASSSAMSCIHLGMGEMPFASIPASALGVGTILNIQDSTVNTLGATVAGGGTFHVQARYNGTVWKVSAV
jgi:hypothetical protein